MTQEFSGSGLRYRATITLWLLAAAAYGFFQLLDLQLAYRRLLSPCSGDGCFHTAISAAEVAVLQSWGMSTRSYAAVMVGATVLYVAVSWLLAGLIFWRQRHSRVGLFFALILLAIPFGSTADPLNTAATHPGFRLPMWIMLLVGICMIFLFLFLFPDGRFAPSWLRYPAVGILIFVAIATLVTAGPVEVSPASDRLIIPGYLLAVLSGIGSQIYRYRRVSTPIERLQTRWVVAGLSIYVTGFPLWGLLFGPWVSFPAGEIRLLVSVGGWLLLTLISMVMPLSVAIAITRYRLWDIDLIVRRTLIYSMLTASLSLVFFSSVVLLQAALGIVLGGRQTELVTVGSTLAVAALFTPLRLRIQRLIDRRFYRQRYDVQNIMSDFNASLRNDVDLDSLRRSILDVVKKSMQPTTVSLWLRDDEQGPR